MNIDGGQKADQGDKPLTRADVEKLLIEVGDSAKLDLSNMNLVGVDLSLFRLKGVNLEGANLWRANLIGIHLEKATLEKATLIGANLERANLTGTNLRKTDLEGAYFKGVRLKGAHLEGAHLERAYLRGVNLEGVNLEGAHLEGAHLGEVNLKGVHLKGAYLEKAHLERAHLEGAYLERAHLEGAYLERAHLEGAYLEGAYLEGAHLEGAYLEGAYLEGAHLEGAHLEGAYLTGIYFERALVALKKVGFRVNPLTGKVVLDTESIALSGIEHVDIAEELSHKADIVEIVPTLRVRIMEEPLTVFTIINALSVFAGFFTKCWLLAEGRFSDLAEFSQTGNTRFVEEMGLAVESIRYNSPLVAGINFPNLDPKNIAEAVKIAVDTVMLAKQRLKQAELETQGKADQLWQAQVAATQEHERKQQEMEIAAQKAALDQGLGELERERLKFELERQRFTFRIDMERQRLDLEKQQLALQRERMEVERMHMDYALEAANKVVDLLTPSVDQTARALLVQHLLPDLLRFQNGAMIELTLPAIELTLPAIETGM